MKIYYIVIVCHIQSTNRKIIRQFVTSAITQDTAIDDVHIFKRLIKFIEMLMVPRLCGYKFTKKYNLYITNNFGTLQNNIFNNYIKNKNIDRNKILYIVNTFRLSIIILYQDIKRDWIYLLVYNTL